MRRAGSVRRRSNGTFEIRYDLGFDPVTGKRKQGSKTVTGTKKDADKELNLILSNINKNEHIEPSKITTAEFLEQWLAAVKSQVNPKTHERYAEYIKNFLLPSFGKFRLSKLAPLDIQRVYNDWGTTGRKDQKEGGLSPRTRLHIHRVFNSALRYALKIPLISRNPLDAVIPPKPKKSPITTVLTVEQSALLLQSLEGSKLYWPVLLALTTGMRRGEILALRWKNVDFQTNTVRVAESLEQTKDGLRFKAPKNECTRSVLLPNYAAQKLQGLKKEQAKRLAEVKVKQTEETLVCSRWDGMPVHPRTITHKFVAAMNRLPDLPKVRFHDLRHSHATQLLRSKIHPKIAQERLGHSSIAITLDLYSHFIDSMQDEAASKLDEAFNLASKPLKKASPPQTPKLG